MTRPLKKTLTSFVAAAALLSVAVPAQAASGTWDRAWGKDVNGGGVFGICTVASSCLTGTTGGLSGEMNNVSGVATDPAGNAYVADSSNNRIQKFDSAGNFLRAWGRDVVLSGEHNTGGFEICVNPAGSNPDDVCKAGTSGGLGGEMALPLGLATDSAGNVWVADTINHRIQKFDSSGNFQLAWGRDAVLSGEHNTGTGFEICVNPAGSNPDDVCKAGTAGGLGGEMNGPEGVATDSGGNVYVSDTSNHRVQRFDSAGTFERTWGKDVVLSGEHNTGTGFETCVNTAGSNPDDVCQAGTSGGLGGEMNFPEGLANDSAGNVYVADAVSNRIQKFDSTGAFERTWGKGVNMTTGGNLCTAASLDTCQASNGGTGLGGEVGSPFGVATDSAGNVYVGEVTRNRIEKFDPAGTFLRAWGQDVINGGGSGFEICVAGVDTCKAGIADGPGGALSAPRGVATDAAGSVYVADTSNVRIQKFADAPVPPPVDTPPVLASPAANPATAPVAKRCKKGKKLKKGKCVKKKRKK